MNPRRYPRTLQEAFGPHTSREIQPTPEPMQWQDRLVIAASCIAAAALVVLMIVEWFA